MIDKTAIIDPSARLAPDVTVGPWSIIGPDVEIGAGTWIGPHVIINGPTRIGKDNKFFQFSSIGELPQDLKFRGEKTWLEMGDRNVVREFCTFNRGTVQDNSVTRIGNDNLFMAYVHIAHDCQVANHTIFANNASLAGHVHVGDFVVLGGFAGVSQFCRMGDYSFASGASIIVKDIPPFVKVSGHYAKPFGLNSVGLKRHGFSHETLAYLRLAYKTIYRKSLTSRQAIEQLGALVSTCPEVQKFIDFLSTSRFGIAR